VAAGGIHHARGAAREFADEYQPLLEELKAYREIVEYAIRYHHFVGVDESRDAYRAALGMSGEAGLAVKAHLEILAESRPSSGRKRKKPDEPAVTKS
jgi:hypothetical protein